MAKKAEHKPRDHDIWGTWLQSMSNPKEWRAGRIPSGEMHTPYVREIGNSDGSWGYYAYRNGRLVGYLTDKSRDKARQLAQARCKLGKVPDDIVAEDRAMQKFVTDTPRDIDAFKKLKKISQDAVAAMYPWALPRKSDQEAKLGKVVLSKRTDLMNKHEKQIAKGGKFDLDKKIKIVKKGNPKKEGSRQWQRWEIIIANNGKTLQEATNAGADKYGIEAMLEMGYMELV